MVEITGERVTRVWKHGMQKWNGREDIVVRHMASWVLAVSYRGTVDRPLPPVELIWDNDVVVGVRCGS